MAWRCAPTHWLISAQVEPASSFVFFFIFVAALYSCGSNILGKQPNQIPIISSAAEQSIGPF